MTMFAQISPEKRKEFLDVMSSLQDQKLRAKGVTASNWQEDPRDPTCFHLLDEWESGEDLKRYCSTENFRVFLGALKTLCVVAEVKCEPLHGEAEDDTLANFSCKNGKFEI